MNSSGAALRRKQAAAAAALSRVPQGCRLGLGCGSTVAEFIRLLAARIGEGLAVRAIAACGQSEALARRLGVPLHPAAEMLPLDVMVDGSDEIDPSLRLIKGGGGALLHEKILAGAAREFVVIAGAEKLVARLGRFPLPVEVAPFGCAGTLERLRREAAALGCEGEMSLRRDGEGGHYVSDGGHWICDCAFGAIPEPEALAAALDGIAGVLGHGLFLGMADRAILGEDDGVRMLQAEKA